jgi:hypothetical protein
MDYSSSIQWFYEAHTYPLGMSTHNMLWAYMVFYIDGKNVNIQDSQENCDRACLCLLMSDRVGLLYKIEILDMNLGHF